MKTEKFAVHIRFIEQMLGTAPKDKAVYESWILSNLREQLTKGQITKEEFEAKEVEELASIKEVEEKGWTGFRQDATGLFILDYMVRGFLKNAGKVLADQNGVTAAASNIDKFAFVGPRNVYLKKDGVVLKQGEGVVERPLRFMTKTGPMTALIRSDAVAIGTECDFTVEVVENKKVSAEYVKGLFDYGRLCGLGQFRNGSYGRFEVVEIKDIKPPKPSK